MFICKNVTKLFKSLQLLTCLVYFVRYKVNKNQNNLGCIVTCNTLWSHKLDFDIYLKTQSTLALLYYAHFICLNKDF